MGSYCALKFDELSVLESKSHVPDELISLFQEFDRVDITEPAEDEGEEPEITYTYRAARQVILDRLDILAITSSAAELAFETWRRGEIELQKEIADDDTETLKAIESLSFEKWKERVHGVLKKQFREPNSDSIDETERRMLEYDDSWLLFEATDKRLMLRALLDACPNVQNVTLDITDLVYGGWLESDIRLCEAARLPANIGRPMHEPTIILGEGSTDIHVLRSSLAILFPHLVEYFGFFDHAELNVDGGASYLVKFLQAFGAARISSRIVAIFDNDTIGREAFEKAQELDLPENIKVLKLPDIEIARAYPSIGPQGAHVVDINGRAGSIELYLGRRNLLADTNTLTPIRWRGYSDRMNAYQGEIEGKSEILRRFNRDLRTYVSPIAARVAYPELVAVWQSIFEALKVMG